MIRLWICIQRRTVHPPLDACPKAVYNGTLLPCLVRTIVLYLCILIYMVIEICARRHIPSAFGHPSKDGQRYSRYLATGGKVNGMDYGELEELRGLIDGRG